ncbi:hypothetical protein EKO29_09725 [Colwellia sp. Arc7-635]|uniref:hypothetical protein n=1 Tax=Colwellia sp. Arc7-635 TaxID=2497879 RepID=UPI000F853B6A|nr:hypothetical protein [Colwellia sp. Arc7-635]AZQ84275.1 hypothetical protein EKO29_09725 [Colwellia sp. Arc7-635]
MWLEHGSFEFEVVGQILIMRPKGAWNFETALRCCQEYKELAKTLLHSPWACLVDLSSWELGTPDIWNEIDKVNAWADQNNEKFEAVICSNSLQITLLEQTYNKYKNVQTAFFETESEALKWLNIKLLADKN